MVAAKRRPTTARRAPIRRTIPRGPASFARAVAHRFKQFVDGGSVSSLGGRFVTQLVTAQTIQAIFRLSDCPQSTSFTAIFDQYRILSVKISLLPMSNSAIISQSGAPIGNPGLLCSVIDYDDATALASFTAAEQYDSFKFQAMIDHHPHVRYLRPRTANIMLAAAAYTGQGPSIAGTWISCGTPSVDHYGVKFWIDAYAAATFVQTFQIMCEYVMEFKNLR